MAAFHRPLFLPLFDRLMISLFPLQAGLARFVGPLAFGALGCSALLADADPVTPAAKAADAPPAFEGHVLVTPLKSKETVLVDGKGKEVHVWTSAYEAAAGARLLPDGSILRMAVEKPAKTFRTTGLQGGRVQRIGWNGEVLWDFWNAATYHMAVGDALTLPNGNVLMLVVEYKGQDEVIALGRDRDRVTFEGLYAPGLMEFEPKGDKGGRLVWRWSAWDHVSQDRHPDKPGYDAKTANLRQWDINTGIGSRGLPALELDYHEASNLVLLTLPSIGEIWLIDHSTETKEAAGDRGGNQNFGGRPLVRWRANEADAAQFPSKVLSSAFTPGAADAAPSIRVMSIRGTMNSTVSFQVESLVSRWVGTDEGRRLENLSTQTLRRWNEPSSTLQALFPGSLMSGPGGSYFLVRKRIGTVEWLGISGNDASPAWSYRNTRGMTTFGLTSNDVIAEECCLGADNPPQPDARRISGLNGPLIGNPRFYTTGYLKLAPAASGGHLAP